MPLISTGLVARLLGLVVAAALLILVFQNVLVPAKNWMWSRKLKPHPKMRTWHLVIAAYGQTGGLDDAVRQAARTVRAASHPHHISAITIVAANVKPVNHERLANAVAASPQLYGCGLDVHKKVRILETTDEKPVMLDALAAAMKVDDRGDTFVWACPACELLPGWDVICEDALRAAAADSDSSAENIMLTQQPSARGDLQFAVAMQPSPEQPLMVKWIPFQHTPSRPVPTVHVSPSFVVGTRGLLTKWLARLDDVNLQNYVPECSLPVLGHLALESGLIAVLPHAPVVKGVRDNSNWLDYRKYFDVEPDGEGYATLAIRDSMIEYTMYRDTQEWDQFIGNTLMQALGLVPQGRYSFFSYREPLQSGVGEVSAKYGSLQNLRENVDRVVAANGDAFTDEDTADVDKYMDALEAEWTTANARMRQTALAGGGAIQSQSAASVSGEDEEDGGGREGGGGDGDNETDIDDQNSYAL